MLPLNAEARRIANAWDPAEVSGADQCKSYGAAAIMRVPGRLNIHWTDDDTLQMDIDSGTQTRMFHFNSAVPARQGSRMAGLLGGRVGTPGEGARSRRSAADAVEGDDDPYAGRLPAPERHSL